MKYPLLRLYLLSLVWSLAITGVSAQRLRLERGSLAALRQVRSFAISFRYDSMTVSRKHIPEQEYVNERIDELNAHRRNQGDTWAAGWRHKRAELYEPAFISAFEQEGLRVDAAAQPGTGYRILFSTTHTEAGYNIGIRRRSSRIDGEARIVSSAHPDEVIAVISLKKCLGKTDDGYDFNTGQRLIGSYEVAGAALARFLKAQP